MYDLFGVPEVFFENFSAYNQAIWPMQIVTYVLGIVTVILTIKKINYSDKIISAILAFLWLWAGVVWCLVFFGQYRFIYYIAGVMLIAQSAVLFLYGYGMLKPPLSFKFRSDSYSVIGILVILYALVIYPIIAQLTGLGYPKAPVFGVAPCPVCIFTFGFLLLADKKVPVSILIIPLMWSLLGIVAGAWFGIFADFGMAAIGIASFVLILHRNKVFVDVPGKPGSDIKQPTPA
jgi:hypothetical protein